MDFVIESTVIDKEKRLIRFSLKPDPARYEERTFKGEECYFDKLDKLIIPKKELAQAASRSVLPLYPPRPSIKNLNSYFSEAKSRIEKSLQSEVDWKLDVRRGETYLELNSGRKLPLLVIYVDIVHSTQLSRILSNVAIRTLIGSFLQEMSLLVDGHGGFIHKYTGDGLIAFFPAEFNSVGVTDSAVDAAVSMKMLNTHVLNPILKSRSYPSLECKIGIDSGETQIVELGAKPDRVLDLLSYTMNLAAKICNVCPPNRILIGESVYTNLHVTRKVFFELCKLSKDKWSYLDANTNNVYPLFLSTTQT